MGASLAAIGTALGASAETAAVVGAAAVGTTAAAGASAYSSHEATSAQKDANAQSRKNAQAAAQQADEANNKANQKRANSSALLSSNQQAGKGGTAGTMLTGPGGVAANTLQLGKTTLLGG